MLSVFGLLVGLGACGRQGKPPTVAGVAHVKVEASAQGLPQGALEVLRRQRLMGDEDDDESPSNRTSYAHPDKDLDFDNDSNATQAKTFVDSDDMFGVYGRPAKANDIASASDMRAVSRVFKRYQAAALAADGSRACSLIFSLLVEAIPEDYGRAAGPKYARGKTCAVVVTKLLTHNHARFVAMRQYRVVQVQVKRNYAVALLGARTQPASLIPLQRERGVWKVDALSAAVLP